ncbi:hypothetical protein KSP40_PGU005312 [Platanthera guangdongensis]|uniref:DWNN domain-containing protein n=1 Tax=Platanthera guangdongensis TaxID=2320717 RepID=A0ABR2LQD4_9ASPA
MAVYYKFKSAKDYDSIPIEGQFISVANLKERIFESKHLGRGTDFDLLVSNAQSNEEYVDEAAMIPKNTSILIRRIPGQPRYPIVTERAETIILEDKIEDIPLSSSMMVGDSSAMKYPEESEWDEFGNDLYSIPEVHHAQPIAPIVDVSPVDRVDEDSKIKALVDTPALDWNRHGHDSYGGGRGFGRGMGGRMMSNRGFGRGVLEKKTPPTGYICHRCKVAGHFIQHCPTNGDPNYDIRRVKPPTGIPRSMLMATPDGSYALPSGAVAVLKPNEAAFEREIDGLPSTRSISDLPPEFHCPFCKEVMKDAVLTSKCCFRSFCDKCIRDYIIANSKCVCGAANILADDLLPNKTLRETISRILESATSSTENAGSAVQVQDMESALPKQPRVPSPTFSAASKGEPSQPPLDQTADTMEVEGVSQPKTDTVEPHSPRKKPEKIMEPAEATPWSTNVKEMAFAETNPSPEEALEKLPPGDQGKKKKKKKTRIAVTGVDMQWRGFQDFGVENFGVPMGPSGYNPYWTNGMPIGMDGYMQPMAGPLPYMGYTPGPFDMPFGGMLPHDPYAGQGYMMPAFPQRDLAELGMNGFSINQGPPLMSREDFDARKVDMRRKREMDRQERISERDYSREREKGGPTPPVKEASIVCVDGPGPGPGPLLKAKPRLRSQAATVDRSDRECERDEKPEKPIHMDRYLAPARDSGRYSPPLRAAKRRASEPDREQDAAAAAAAGEVAAKAERKQKGSVFSRISFPAEPGEVDRASSKRRKTSSEPPANGLKEDRHDRERPVINGYTSSSAVARSSSAGGGYDHESSDEERHFKRRSSSSRREPAEKEKEEREEEDGGARPSRVLRERDNRVHERHDAKRRC